MSDSNGRHDTPVRLETLEDRNCPSVTSVVSNGVLTVTGTEGADTVSVRATGDNRFTVSDSQGEFTNVQRVVIDLRGGDDTLNLDTALDMTTSVQVLAGAGNDAVNVSYGLAASSSSKPIPMPTSNLQLSIDLGAGNNRFQLVDNNGNSGGLNVSVQLNGGAGNDDVNLSLNRIQLGGKFTFNANLGEGSNTLAANALVVNERAAANFSITGGSADDRVTLNLGNLASGAKVSVNANLGGGNDTLDQTFARIAGDASLGIGAQLGDGDDRFSLGIQSDEGSRPTVNLDGGTGFDTADFQVNGAVIQATITNVEQVTGIDTTSTTPSPAPSPSPGYPYPYPYPRPVK